MQLLLYLVQLYPRTLFFIFIHVKNPLTVLYCKGFLMLFISVLFCFVGKYHTQVDADTQDTYKENDQCQLCF